MASRWLQQKIAKQRRMRRAWAKPFSMRNTGPMKHPGYINNTKDKDGNPRRELVDFGIGARSNAASSTFDSYLLQKFRFKPDGVEAIYARTQGLHTDLSGHLKSQTPPRKPQKGDDQIILAKLVQSKLNAGSVQGEQRFVQHICRKEPNHEVRLFISGDDCFFVSEQFTNTEAIYRLSTEYVGAERAMSDFRSDNILWDTTERKPLLQR